MFANAAVVPPSANVLAAKTAVAVEMENAVNKLHR